MRVARSDLGDVDRRVVADVRVVAAAGNAEAEAGVAFLEHNVLLLPARGGRVVEAEVGGGAIQLQSVNRSINQDLFTPIDRK